MIYDRYANIIIHPADLAVFQEVTIYNDFWRSINDNDKDSFLVINNYIRYYFYNNFDFIREYKNTPLHLYRRFLRHGEHTISWELRPLPYRWGHLYGDDTGVSLHANTWLAFQYINSHKQSVDMTTYDVNESDYMWLIQDMIIYNDIKIHNKLRIGPHERILDIKPINSLSLEARIYLLSMGCVNCTMRNGAIINGVTIPIIIAKNTVLSLPVAMISAANIARDIASVNGYYSKYIEHILKKQIYYPYTDIVKALFSDTEQSQSDILTNLNNLYTKIAVDLIENKSILTYVRIGKIVYPLINIIVTTNIECKMKNIVINKLFMINFHHSFKLYSFWVMNRFWMIAPGGKYVIKGRCCKENRLDWDQIRFVKGNKNIHKITISKSVMSNYSLSDIWKTHKGYYTLRRICKSFISKIDKLKDNLDDICKNSADVSSGKENKDILVNITTYFNIIGWTQFTDEYYKKV